MKKINLLLWGLVVAAIGMASTSTAHAFVTTTGGDGFIPIIVQDKIFNIYHHQSPSGDPVNPNVDIDCFAKAGGATCPGYPRYFSSDVGSTGELGSGTPGTADIYTTFYPHSSSVIGSRIFYAAQRTGDNGIGCFDTNSNTNCGYFPLGSSLALSANLVDQTSVDGLIQEGNKLYSVGKDMQMYCLDVTNPLAPVACAGQPYAFNTGITGTLPAYNGDLFEAPDNASDPDHSKMFIEVNYNSATPASDARLTCFDTNTNARCAGWTSADITGTSVLPSRSVMHIFDTSGNFTGVCVNKVITQSPQCFNTATMASVPAPPNFLSGVTSPAPSTTWVWDHIDSGHNTVYLALSAGGSDGQSGDGLFGEAYCYDFTTQNACAGFGTNGVKAWDGSDGGLAVNGGNTRDYGYALDRNCMYGLGDAGVLWSFTAATGAVAPGALDCTANNVLGASALGSSTTNPTPGLPDTGVAPIAQVNKLLLGVAVIGVASASYPVYAFGKKRISSRKLHL